MLIGAQLFTLRDFCKTTQDLDETLKKVADMGMTTVQLSGICGYEADWMDERLKAYGLTADITHFSYDRIIKEAQQTADFHNRMGCKYIGIGGIFGIIEGGASATGAAAITNCTNNGNVKGSWGIGGIAGDTPGTITGCVNNGTLNASGDLGGIVGKFYGKATECTNNGDVIGTSVNVGGIVGRLHVATYLDVINTTNENNGSIVGAKFGDIIGCVE